MHGRGGDDNDPLESETAEALELLRDAAPQLCAADTHEPSLRLLALAQAIGVPGSRWSQDVARWSAERLAGAVADYLRKACEWPFSRVALQRAAMLSCGYPPFRRPTLRLVCVDDAALLVQPSAADQELEALRELRNALAHLSVEWKSTRTTYRRYAEHKFSWDDAMQAVDAIAAAGSGRSLVWWYMRAYPRSS